MTKPNKTPEIAVQLIVPGGKNVVKLMTLSEAIKKMARVRCASTPKNLKNCKNCGLNGFDMCALILETEGHVKLAAAMLNALFDGQLAAKMRGKNERKI